ncbi:succinate dehydrogenase, cytochrome b556 subunit [Altererythrobacter sp.]|nr:succinate dehydrogenase, cytochrome b556 subunit [Altererythrobacter sp.]
MEDDRPLSPHLASYKPQLTSIFSILHRISGAVLALPFLLLSAWVIGAAAGSESFAMVHGLATSWLGIAILMAGTAALAFHLLNGIRHLLMDLGVGMELGAAYGSGWLVGFLAAGLTVLGWIALLWNRIA